MLLLTRALLAAAVLSGAACDVYDSNLPYANWAEDSSVGHDACIASIEICNGKDDDCDGVTDEKEAVEIHCGSMLKNTQTRCEKGYCLRDGDCHEGFFNCDGMPDNGCEATCPCTGCPPEDDAGA